MARVTVLIVCAALLSGCSRGETTTASRVVVTLEHERFPPAHLAAGECFAGIRGVAILGEVTGGPRSCARIALGYFGAKPRTSWPPALLRSSDAMTACTLQRAGETLAVVSAAEGDDERSHALATRICRDLRAAGWRRLPLG